jgi:hypothetical protein
MKLKIIAGKHQQAAGENDRHDPRLIDPQRQVLARAAIDPPTPYMLGTLRRDPPLPQA